MYSELLWQLSASVCKSLLSSCLFSPKANCFISSIPYYTEGQP